MIKKNVTIYICDLCTKRIEVNGNQASPMYEISLPAKNYDEVGKFKGATVSSIDLCCECLNKVHEALSKHYKITNRSNIGLEIKEVEE